MHQGPAKWEKGGELLAFSIHPNKLASYCYTADEVLGWNRSPLLVSAKLKYNDIRVWVPSNTLLRSRTPTDFCRLAILAQIRFDRFLRQACIIAKENYR